MTIVERIELELNKKGITPSTMSKELGFSSGLFTQWKHGQKPSFEKLEKVALFLDCSVDYLMGTETTKTETTKLELDEREQELLRLFREHSPEKQDSILSLLRK